MKKRKHEEGEEEKNKKTKENKKEIEELIIKGNNFTITKDDIILNENKMKFSNDDKTLTIYEESNNINGSSFINFSGISSNRMTINGCSVSSNNNEIKISNVGNKKVIIDGNDITNLIKKHKNTSDKKEEKEKTFNYSKKYLFKLKKIIISGSGNLKVKQWMLYGKKLKAIISGSGDIFFDHIKIEDCNISVSGSGDVEGNCEIDDLDISVSGSGDVKGLHVKKSVDASVSGSGDIKITKEKNTNVSKSKSGSGSIKINAI